MRQDYWLHSMLVMIIGAGLFLCTQDLRADSPDPVAASAADDAGFFDQIVVVAHKDERSIRDIAANVTVLSRDQLTGDLATSLNDVFRYVPGVDTEAAGTRFGSEGVNIRGIGGNRVAMIVDGVPVTDHFAVGSFSNATRDFIDAGLLQSIEVLHGPASALYGSSAIGGVIAIRTPDPFDITGADGHGGEFLATWRGVDQSVHGQTMIAFGDRSLGVLAGASWRDGHETDSAGMDAGLDTRDFNRRSGLLKMVADDPWGHTLNVAVTHQSSKTLSDLNSMLGTGRFRSTTALEGDDRYRLDIVNVSYEFAQHGGRIDSGVLRVFQENGDVSQTTLDERGAAATPVAIERFFSFDQVVRGAELNLWKEIDTGNVSQRIGFGIEYRQRTTEEYRDGLQTDLSTGEQTNVLLGEEFPLRDFPVSDTSEIGAYVEDTISVGNWSIIAALRADRFRLSPEQDPMFLEDYPFAELVSIDESDVSPKLGVVYNVTPEVDVYVQYSHGFRAPPYADANIGLDIPFFNYRAIPNPDLRSESSNGVDIGLRWQGTGSSVHLSVFHTRYDDFIESKVRLGTDPDTGLTLFQSLNLRETRIEGVEAGWSMRLGGVATAWSLDGSAYYARGRNVDTGGPLNSVGPAQAVIGINWHAANDRRQLRFNTTVTQAWNERDETRAVLFKPPGHAVFDLYLAQDIGSTMVLRAGLHNLADRRYWNWSDVRGLSPSDPILPTLAQAGRSVSVSLNMNW